MAPAQMTFRPPTLHHVNLKTTRLKEMIDWYGTVVGLKPQHVAPVGAWLANDAANHRLALLAFPGMSDDVDKDSHTGIHHMAFEFSSLDELFGNFARLRTLGITPSVCLDHGPRDRSEQEEARGQTASARGETSPRTSTRPRQPWRSQNATRRR